MPSVELLIHDHFAEASDIIKGVSEQWLVDTPQIESIVQWEMLKGLGVTGSRTVIGICLLLSGTVGFFLQAQSNLPPKSTRLTASASE